MRRSRPQTEIWWFEPRWSREPEIKRVTDFVVHWRFWILCVLLPYLCYAALILLISSKVPEVKSDLPQLLFYRPFAIVFLVLFLRYGFIWIPQMVAINSKGIFYAGKWIARDQIAALRVEMPDPARSYLCIRKTPASTQPANRWLAKLTKANPLGNDAQIGISEKIAVPELIEFIRNQLPEIKISRQ